MTLRKWFFLTPVGVGGATNGSSPILNAGCMRGSTYANTAKRLSSSLTVLTSKSATGRRQTSEIAADRRHGQFAMGALMTQRSVLESGLRHSASPLTGPLPRRIVREDIISRRRGLLSGTRFRPMNGGSAGPGISATID